MNLEANKKPIVPNERLAEIDKLMMAPDGKLFVNLTASHRGHRIEVTITRIPDEGKGTFKAAAKFAGHTHVARHTTPSNAFAGLIWQLRYRAAQIAVDANRPMEAKP